MGEGSSVKPKKVDVVENVKSFGDALRKVLEDEVRKEMPDTDPASDWRAK